MHTADSREQRHSSKDRSCITSLQALSHNVRQTSKTFRTLFHHGLLRFHSLTNDSPPANQLQCLGISVIIPSTSSGIPNRLPPLRYPRRRPSVRPGGLTLPLPATAAYDTVTVGGVLLLSNTSKKIPISTTSARLPAAHSVDDDYLPYHSSLTTIPSPGPRHPLPAIEGACRVYRLIEDEHVATDDDDEDDGEGEEVEGRVAVHGSVAAVAAVGGDGGHRGVSMERKSLGV